MRNPKIKQYLFTFGHALVKHDKMSGMLLSIYSMYVSTTRFEYNDFSSNICNLFIT